MGVEEAARALVATPAMGLQLPEEPAVIAADPTPSGYCDSCGCPYSRDYGHEPGTGDCLCTTGPRTYVGAIAAPEPEPEVPDHVQPWQREYKDRFAFMNRKRRR